MAVAKRKKRPQPTGKGKPPADALTIKPAIAAVRKLRGDEFPKEGTVTSWVRNSSILWWRHPSKTFAKVVSVAELAAYTEERNGDTSKGRGRANPLVAHLDAEIDRQTWAKIAGVKPDSASQMKSTGKIDRYTTRTANDYAAKQAPKRGGYTTDRGDASTRLKESQANREEMKENRERLLLYDAAPVDALITALVGILTNGVNTAQQTQARGVQQVLSEHGVTVKPDCVADINQVIEAPIAGIRAQVRAAVEAMHNEIKERQE